MCARHVGGGLSGRKKQRGDLSPPVRLIKSTISSLCSAVGRHRQSVSSPRLFPPKINRQLKLLSCMLQLRHGRTGASTRALDGGGNLLQIRRGEPDCGSVYPAINLLW